MTADPTDQSPPPSTTNELDPDALKYFGLKVWTYKMGEVVSLMIHLGDRLGLYTALNGSGPTTAAQLAATTDLQERLLHEWLMGQAAAGLIDRHEEGTFELTGIQAALLADESDSVDFAAGSFQGGYRQELIEGIADSFRTGLGLTYEQQGPEAAAGLARMTAPRSRHDLTATVVPGIEGLAQQLQDGTKVVEIGCGAGVALRILAQTFPNSTFVGIDPSPSALDLAIESANTDGLGNISFVEGFAVDVEQGGDVGLVMAFDCLHDMPRPDEAVVAAHGALTDDGILLVKEIRSSGDFDRDLRNPLLSMLYGFSVTSCLQSALSEPNGLGLGTVGLHPKRLNALVTDAGFGAMELRDFGDPGNLYYEIRK